MVPTELSVGEATKEPPAAAVNHVTPVAELSTVRESRVCNGLCSHWVIVDCVTAGGNGAGVMVKVTGVRVVLEQVPFEYSAK
jgi:hypothetical protein